MKINGKDFRPEDHRKPKAEQTKPQRDAEFPVIPIKENHLQIRKKFKRGAFKAGRRGLPS